jgi:hypothetical protein
MKKIFFAYYFFSKIKSHKEVTNSRNQCFSYYFCLLKYFGFGSGSATLPEIVLFLHLVWLPSFFKYLTSFSAGKRILCTFLQRKGEKSYLYTVPTVSDPGCLSRILIFPSRIPVPCSRVNKTTDPDPYK